MRESSNGDISLAIGSDLTCSLSESVQMAAEQVAARPLSSYTDLNSDLSTNHPLINAYKDEIHNTIRQRLSEDPDYNPEEYPNAEKFFGSTNK